MNTEYEQIQQQLHRLSSCEKFLKFTRSFRFFTAHLIMWTTIGKVINMEQRDMLATLLTFCQELALDLNMARNGMKSENCGHLTWYYVFLFRSRSAGSKGNRARWPLLFESHADTNNSRDYCLFIHLCTGAQVHIQIICGFPYLPRTRIVPRTCHTFPVESGQVSHF